MFESILIKVAILIGLAVAIIMGIAIFVQWARIEDRLPKW
jgi:energy-converting hydrogenase Eha subunit A